MKSKIFKKVKSISVISAIMLAAISSSTVFAAGDSGLLTDAAIEPHQGTYGYYVDVNETTTSEVVLTEFLKLWTPGTEWHNGTKVNADVLNSNIQQAYAIAGARTEEQAQAAYDDEFNDQNYSMLDGLGQYKEAFIAKSGVGTDSTKWQYDESAPLSSVVNLVTIFRNSNASTNNAKAYYQYPRPYRWNVETGEVVTEGYVESQVVAAIAEKKGLATRDASSDGGFPSGHTNGAYLGTLALAYAVPEQYNELLMRAAELGNNRIVAGMHSPLDVMGGRTAATAVAAAAINRESNAEAKTAAYEAVHTNLITDSTIEQATASDYDAYQQDLSKYLGYMTYGFDQIDDTTEAMRVPKGAETLFETRYPYLDATQIRWVLYSTGLESGYPVLDDAEGWGRLNLYAAANGYGAFNTDVVADMDASEGGYCETDNWMNDISGAGSLTKDGTGTLVLAGHNSYTGGTAIEGGSLVAASQSALGSGDVQVSAGTLEENVSGQVTVSGNYVQKEGGTLKLDLQSSSDVLDVTGSVSLDGNLEVSVPEDYSAEGDIVLIDGEKISGSFDAVSISGLEDTYQVKYTENQVLLSKQTEKVEDDNQQPPKDVDQDKPGQTTDQKEEVDSPDSTGNTKDVSSDRSDSTSKKVSSVKTADTAPIGAGIAVSIGAAGAIGGLLYKKRKDHIRL